MTPDGEERERTVEEEEGRVNVQGQKEETIKRVKRKKRGDRSEEGEERREEGKGGG